MAMRDEIRQQRQKLRGKGLKAHWEWFVEYDLFKAVIVAVIVIFAAVVIYESATNLPYVFGVMFINADLSDDQEERLEEDFAAYADIDLEESQMLIDLSASLSMGDTSSYYDYTYMSTVMARTAAQQLDAWVSDAWNFARYTNNGEFTDLREVLDEETLERYSDSIYYADQAVLDAEDEEEEDEEDTETLTQEDVLVMISTENYVLPDPSEMEDPVPYGIVVSDASYIVDNHNYDGIVCIFGVVAGGENPEGAALFLEYLFDYQAEE